MLISLMFLRLKNTIFDIDPLDMAIDRIGGILTPVSGAVSMAGVSDHL